MNRVQIRPNRVQMRPSRMQMVPYKMVGSYCGVVVVGVVIALTGYRIGVFTTARS